MVIADIIGGFVYVVGVVLETIWDLFYNFFKGVQEILAQMAEALSFAGTESRTWSRGSLIGLLAYSKS